MMLDNTIKRMEMEISSLECKKASNPIKNAKQETETLVSSLPTEKRKEDLIKTEEQPSSPDKTTMETDMVLNALKKGITIHTGTHHNGEMLLSLFKNNLIALSIKAILSMSKADITV